jgi:hypothetical protein
LDDRLDDRFEDRLDDFWATAFDDRFRAPPLRATTRWTMAPPACLDPRLDPFLDDFFDDRRAFFPPN